MTGEKHLRLLLCCSAWGTLFCLVIAWVAILFSSLRFPFAAGLAVGYVLLSEDLASGDCSFFFLFFPIDP